MCIILYSMPKVEMFLKITNVWPTNTRLWHLCMVAYIFLNVHRLCCTHVCEKHAHIHAYIHTYVHAHIRTYVHTYIHTHTNAQYCTHNSDPGRPNHHIIPRLLIASLLKSTHWTPLHAFHVSLLLPQIIHNS